MQEYQSIGFTKKTYGVEGAIKVKILDEHLEDLAAAEVLFIELEGRKIPYFVEDVHFENPFTIKLEDYNTKEAAMELAGKEIFMRKSDLLAEEEKTIMAEKLEFEHLQGYQIKDEFLGLIGKIETVMEYPQQEMAAVHYDNREILIPLNEHLIQNIDEANQTILMTLPEGLLKLE